MNSYEREKYGRSKSRELSEKADTSINISNVEDEKEYNDIKKKFEKRKEKKIKKGVVNMIKLIENLDLE